MLNDRFLARLSDEFPQFYAQVDEEARADAARLRIQTQGDAAKALARARLEGTARIWWPYVKGSVPLLHRDRAAMEGFTRLVLTVDHVVGYEPGGLDASRDHVVSVLRSSLDVERLKDLVSRREKEEAAAAAAGAGIMASATALMAPVNMLRGARKWARWLPPYARIAAAAVVVAALASIPLVAGYSAGRHAETEARSATQAVEDARPSDDIKRAA